MEDVPVMCRLLDELFQMENDYVPNREKQKIGLESILQRPEIGQLLVLKKETGTIGMANLLFTVSTAEGGRVIILEDFIIAQEERGKGYGRYLMDFIIAWAKKQGFLRITLLVDSCNPGAQVFYAKMGYKGSNMNCLRKSLIRTV